MNFKLPLTLSAIVGLTACSGGVDQNQQPDGQGNTAAFQDQGPHDQQPGTANLTTDSLPSDVDAAVNQVDDANELNTMR